MKGKYGAFKRINLRRIRRAEEMFFDYAHRGSELFNPEPCEMLNDTFLGPAVTSLGLVIWIVVLLVNDPRGVLRKKGKR